MKMKSLLGTCNAVLFDIIITSIKNILLKKIYARNAVVYLNLYFDGS